MKIHHLKPTRTLQHAHSQWSPVEQAGPDTARRRGVLSGSCGLVGRLPVHSHDPGKSESLTNLRAKYVENDAKRSNESREPRRLFDPAPMHPAFQWLRVIILFFRSCGSDRDSTNASQFLVNQAAAASYNHTARHKDVKRPKNVTVQNCYFWDP